MAFLKQMKRKHDHRTIVVPTITSLNPDTWKEIPGQGWLEMTWNDLKSPGTWPPHVINTYKIHDGYVQSNIKIQKTVAYTMWLFPFPDMQIFSFCRPKYPKKNILFQTLCAAFGGQTVAVCLLTTTSDVWQFSCGFLRFPVIFPWTNCKWPFLDHLANGEKEWPFVVGQ